MDDEEAYGGFIFSVDAKMRAGISVPSCLAETMLQTREREQLDNLDMAILASAFMIGDVKTTASIMQWFSALIRLSRDTAARAGGTRPRSWEGPTTLYGE